jgi:hypothetical protein
MLARTPGAVEALRDGSSLVPGHSLPPLPRTRTIDEPRQGD